MLATLRAGAPVRTAEAVGEEETATILYTSGTTGRPKGAMLTHLAIAHSVIHFEFTMGLTEDECGLIAVPMSHVTGLIALVHAMVHCAGTLVVMPAFKARDFIDLAARQRITYSLIVPAMFNLCLLAPNFETADLSSLARRRLRRRDHAGGHARAHRRKAAKLKLLNCYGATETTSPAAIMPPDETVERKEWVGLAVSCGDILVMDADGVEAPHGQPGEIYIGGAMVVPGYFNNTQATEREFVAGYWKSGDLGIMDEKGYLRVIDRIKDVINRGGFKIYASEVENALLKHPAVVEVAVVAKPCPVLGERVHAFVVLRTAVEEAELQRHCAGVLSDYKVPETVRRLEGDAAAQRQWQGSQAELARDPCRVRRQANALRVVLHLEPQLSQRISIDVAPVFLGKRFSPWFGANGEPTSHFPGLSRRPKWLADASELEASNSRVQAAWTRARSALEVLQSAL